MLDEWNVRLKNKNDKTSGQRGRSFLGWLARLNIADRLDTYQLGQATQAS